MTQRINHRRGGKRYQDNGPSFESHRPNGGCDSTHVARSRSKWKKRKNRSERRNGKVTPKYLLISKRGRPLSHEGDTLQEWEDGEDSISLSGDGGQE